MKRLTPNLAVADVAQSVRFYTEVLGFELRMIVDAEKAHIGDALKEDLTYIWANVMHGDVGVMFQQKQSFEEDLGVSVEHTGASASLYMEVEDADALYESLKERVTFHKTIATTWYGAREFYIKDPDGYLLGFSSEVEGGEAFKT